MTKPLPTSILAKIPDANGPGINADEADSMLQSLAMKNGKLAHRVEKLLERIKRESISDEPILTNREALIYLAQLTTGSWGPQTGTTKGDRTAARVKFIDRMRELHSALQYMLEEIHATKPHSISKSSGKKVGNPWIRGYRDGRKPGGLTICFRAVDYLLKEGIARRSIFKGGLPFGLSWGILAKGNGKLPFMAYSELPMATCPGAGDCSVWSNQSGWCYSFKAWRYPDAFARQFLNTLANSADDALAQLRGGRELTKINPKAPAPQQRAWDKYLPPGKRVWPDYVKWLLLYKTRGQRKKTEKNPDGVVFFRLFVDGDMRNSRSVVEWMGVCSDISAGRAATKVYGKGLGHVEVYGYSKAWSDFLTADRSLKGKWPANYTLNLSGGSVWWNVPKIRNAIEKLPVSRGYFVAVNLHGALEEFVDKFDGHMLTSKVTDAQAMKRIQAFTAINEFTSAQDAWTAANQVAADLGIQTVQGPRGARGDDQTILEARAALFTNWIDHLVSDPAYAQRAAKEMVEDGRAKSLGAALQSRKGLRDKVIAMHLHEVLWAFGAGGSCPLVCGNCFDNPDPSDKRTVHRCASKPGRLFGRTLDNQMGATIHIGLH
jgi:hypothetical protein